MANSNGWGDGAANNSIGWGQGANNAIAWGDSHAKSWAGATDIVGLTTDPAASAYFTATGITGATQQTAIDNLVKGLKQDGLWSKMKAVYPFVTDIRNLLGYTEDFSNAVWNKNSSTVTANTTTAPNGTLTADTFSGDGSSNIHNITQSTSNIVAGSPYTTFVYAKKNTNNFIQIVGSALIYPTNTFVNFDLNNGVVGSSNGCTSTINNVGNGWYLCTMTATPTTSGSSNSYIVGLITSSTSVRSEVNTLSTSVYLWGAQLELGSTATTYQPIATTQQAFISNQFKYNLVNPVDSDAAFRLVFNGGWTHSANGATPNGTNGYADTKLVPSSVLQLNSASHSVYSRSLSPVAIMGGVNDVSNYMILNNPTSTTITSQINSIGNDFITGTITNSQGLLMANRTSSTVINAWRNSTKIATDTKNSTFRPTKNYYIGARNNDGTASNFDGKQYGFYHIGDGLTDTEAANLYTRVQAFQTALSRQV